MELEKLLDFGFIFSASELFKFNIAISDVTFMDKFVFCWKMSYELYHELNQALT